MDDGEISWRCPEHGEQARVAVVFDAKAWFARFPEQTYACACGLDCVPHQYDEPAR